jgi:hypothetical protein
MTTYINISISANEPTPVCRKYGTCEFGNRNSVLIPHTVNGNPYHLVRNAPNASPSVVDVVADSVCVSNLTCPFSNIVAYAPLTNIVLNVSIDQVQLGSHVLESCRRLRLGRLRIDHGIVRSGIAVILCTVSHVTLDAPISGIST